LFLEERATISECYEIADTTLSSRFRVKIRLMIRLIVDIEGISDVL